MGLQIVQKNESAPRKVLAAVYARVSTIDNGQDPAQFQDRSDGRVSARGESELRQHRGIPRRSEQRTAYAQRKNRRVTKAGLSSLRSCEIAGQHCRRLALRGPLCGYALEQFLLGAKPIFFRRSRRIAARFPIRIRQAGNGFCVNRRR